MKMLFCLILICASSISFNSVFVGCEEENIFDKGSPEYQAEQVLNTTHRVTLPSLRDVFEAAMKNSHLKIRNGPNGRFDPTIPTKVLYFNARLAYQATEMSKLKAYKVEMLNELRRLVTNLQDNFRRELEALSKEEIENDRFRNDDKFPQKKNEQFSPTRK